MHSIPQCSLSDILWEHRLESVMRLTALGECRPLLFSKDFQKHLEAIDMLQHELTSNQHAIMASLDLLLRYCRLPQHVHQVAMHKLSIHRGRSLEMLLLSPMSSAAQVVCDQAVRPASQHNLPPEGFGALQSVLRAAGTP